jgi:hypothetical protein
MAPAGVGSGASSATIDLMPLRPDPGRMRAVLVVFAIAVSGCIGADDESWKPSDCARGDGPSGNVPPAAFLRGSDEAVASRVAAAFGDPIEGPDLAAERSAYDSARGTWESGGASVVFDGIGEPWVDEGLLREALVILGLDLDALERDEVMDGVGYFQTLEGEVVGWASFSSRTEDPHWWSNTTYTHVELLDLHDLSSARAAISEAEAKFVATEYVGCAQPWRGLDVSHQGTTVDVFAQSQVYGVWFSYPTPGHCSSGQVAVYVDAVTASVLGAQEQGCI